MTSPIVPTTLPFRENIFFGISNHKYKDNTAYITGIDGLPIGADVFAVESGQLTYLFKKSASPSAPGAMYHLDPLAGIANELANYSDSDNVPVGYGLLSVDGERFWSYRGIDGIEIPYRTGGAGQDISFVNVQVGQKIGVVSGAADGIAHFKMSVARRKNGQWLYFDPIETLGTLWMNHPENNGGEAFPTPPGVAQAQRDPIPYTMPAPQPMGTTPVSNRKGVVLGLLAGLVATGTVVAVAVASNNGKK